MRSAALSSGSQVVSRTLRSVVAVSEEPQRAALLNALLIDGNGIDVIVVESIARAYSRIKQVAPDLVIVLMEIDDVDACHLLTMLKIDGDTSHVPIVTWAASPDAFGLEEIAVDLNQDSSLPEALWT